MNHEQLFPRRQSRRDFLALGATAAATSILPGLRAADAPAKFGEGRWTFTHDPAWGTLPEGMKFGFGCGIVVDSKDRIYVTSRSNSPCVAVFDPAGQLLETWSQDFGNGYNPDQVAATAHGIYRSRESDGEYLYFTENAGGPSRSLGRRVYKTDLQGKVLHTIGNVARQDATHQRFEWTNPTDVAVTSNGDIYIVDGYGSQRVSRFDKNFNHLRTIGERTPAAAPRGPGAPHGTFNTCHGVWINTLRDEPEVYIADRANGRYEVYSLELDYRRTVSGDFVRNPCCFYQHDGHLYVPDLGALVAILDKDDRCVARLGDGKAVPKEEKDKRPEFITPHALTVDSKGNLYVLEWVPDGRVRKFAHTPA